MVTYTHKCTLHGQLSSCGRWFLLPTRNWLFVLPWKAAILERGPYTCTLCTCCHGRRPYSQRVHIHVHFWLKVVTLNPVNNQPGERHFICVSMATNQDIHRMLVTVAYCHLPLFNFILLFTFLRTTLFLPLGRNWNILFLFFFCQMPSFTKAKTFAKCPSVYKICCIFFLWTIRVKKKTFYLLCDGGRRLPTALHLPPSILRLVLRKKETLKTKQKKTDS